MAITNFTTLTTAVNDWAERSYSAAKLQELVALAEAEFNLIPGFRTYRRETTDATLTTDSSGEVALPSGFLKMVTITRDYAGALPLEQTAWETLTDLNPYAEAGYPAHYAISGTTLKVAPKVEDDFIATYETSLTALTSGNETNWLITLAPHAYLYMCLAMVEAFNKNFQEAAVWKSQALEKISDIATQSDLARYGNAGVTLDFVTP